jgi:hypothetical protein
VADGKSIERSRRRKTTNQSASMNSINSATLGDIAASPKTSGRLARTDAGNARTACGKSVVEARLWKLTSIVHSPLKRGVEASLFLIISSLGFGLTVYSLNQFVTFFQNDSLTQTITSLLR